MSDMDMVIDSCAYVIMQNANDDEGGENLEAFGVLNQLLRHYVKVDQPFPAEGPAGGGQQTESAPPLTQMDAQSSGGAETDPAGPEEEVGAQTPGVPDEKPLPRNPKKSH